MWYYNFIAYSLLYKLLLWEVQFLGENRILHILQSSLLFWEVQFLGENASPSKSMKLFVYRRVANSRPSCYCNFFPNGHGKKNINFSLNKQSLNPSFLFGPNLENPTRVVGLDKHPGNYFIDHFTTECTTIFRVCSRVKFHIRHPNENQ